MAKKIKAKEDRLSDLPDSILIHILSLLCENSEDSKKVVRTSILSTRWRSLWKSVPVSLDFRFSGDWSNPRRLKNGIQDFIISTHRELHYWRSCQKISKFIMIADFPDANRFAKDVDLWLYFAAELANVEHFELTCKSRYEFPQFAYKNTSWRKLVIRSCRFNPLANVKWSGIVSLSFSSMNLTDHFMEKILSGCPNLECLKFYHVFGFHRLEISNMKSRKLIIENFDNDDDCDIWLEITAPYIQNLEILGSCHGIRLRNVASLVTAVLNFNFDFDFDFDFDFEEEDPLPAKESTCLKELFHSISHVEKLELGPCCIEDLSILELEGWQPPPSGWKFLQLSTTLKQLDFPGICSFLLSSSDLETLVIDGYKESRDQLLTYTNKDEETKRFEAHNFNGSFPHLKTIKILNFSKSLLPLVKYLLKHAIVLEKFVIVARRQRSYVSLDSVEMEQELQSFPRSSPQASVIFSYG